MPVRMILPERAQTHKPEKIRVPMIRGLQPEKIKGLQLEKIRERPPARMMDNPMMQLRTRKVRLSQIRHRPPMPPVLQRQQRRDRIPVFKIKWMPWIRLKRHWIMPCHPKTRTRMPSKKHKPLMTRQKML